MSGKTINNKNSDKKYVKGSGQFVSRDGDGFHKKRHDNRRDDDVQRNVILHAYKWQNFIEDESVDYQDREYAHVLSARNRVSI